METLAETIRRRIRDEMRRQKLSQRDLATRLTWTQSRVGKILTGNTALSVDDLGAMCSALQISLVEVVRDPRLEFVADISPYELRVLERFRDVELALQDAVAVILQVKKPTSDRLGKAPKLGRLPRPPITTPTVAAAK